MRDEAFVYIVLSMAMFIAGSAAMSSIRAHLRLSELRGEFNVTKQTANELRAWQAEANRRLVEFGERPIEVPESK